MAAPVPGFEQRRYPRVPLQFPVKLTVTDTGLRYIAGRTCNLSAGGLYLEIPLDAPAPPIPLGTRLAVAIPKHAGDMLLLAEEAVPATVVRSCESPHSPRGLGLRFDRPVTLAVPTPSRPPADSEPPRAA